MKQELGKFLLLVLVIMIAPVFFRGDYLMNVLVFVAFIPCWQWP